MTWSFAANSAQMLPSYEVRTVGAFDRFGNLVVGRVDEIANLAADGLLPIGQGIDGGVNARIRPERHTPHDSSPHGEAEPTQASPESYGPPLFSTRTGRTL